MTTIAAQAPPTPEPGRIPAARPVTGGVDTHLDVHVAAALDPLGAVLGTASFPTTPAGYRQLLHWLRTFGTVTQVGVEGTGTYGAALTRHLRTQAVPVIEVTRPNRQTRRQHGKTDVIDAIAAGRAVLSGQATAIAKTHDGQVEALRTLKLLLRGISKNRTQAINQLKSLLVFAPDPLRERLRGLPDRELLDTCANFRIAGDDDTLLGTTRYALRELAQRIQDLTTRHTQTKKRMHRITEALAPDLLALKGVGPDTASTLLLTAGDNPDRLHTEQAFAALCGASPIPASSGKTRRYRLNRSGDRQANAALWRIIIVRLGTDQRTKDYLARRLRDGKSKQEAIRCLKRYRAREIFHALPTATTS